MPFADGQDRKQLYDNRRAIYLQKLQDELRVYDHLVFFVVLFGISFLVGFVGSDLLDEIQIFFRLFGDFLRLQRSAAGKHSTGDYPGNADAKSDLRAHVGKLHLPGRERRI